MLKNNLWDKIQYAYWSIIPYDWRPGQMWYRFKCWVRKPNTIKPRHLPNTWCDKDHVMVHMMFELLSKFIEDECSPGHVEWYGEHGHKIEVSGEQVYVMDEMKYLYDWWHEKYNKAYQKETDEIYDQTIDEPLCDENGFFCMSNHNKEVYGRVSNLEEKYENQLNENLIRLLKIRPYMWT